MSRAGWLPPAPAARPSAPAGPPPAAAEPPAGAARLGELLAGLPERHRLLAAREEMDLADADDVAVWERALAALPRPLEAARRDDEKALRTAVLPVLAARQRVYREREDQAAAWRADLDAYEALPRPRSGSGRGAGPRARRGEVVRATNIKIGPFYRRTN